MPQIVYPPDASDAPRFALPCGVRIDQTCLALFILSRLGRQTRKGVGRHFWNARSTVAAGIASPEDDAG